MWFINWKKFPELDEELDSFVPLLDKHYKTPQEIERDNAWFISRYEELWDKVRFIVKGLVVDGWTYVDISKENISYQVGFLKGFLEENEEKV